MLSFLVLLFQHCMCASYYSIPSMLEQVGFCKVPPLSEDFAASLQHLSTQSVKGISCVISEKMYFRVIHWRKKTLRNQPGFELRSSKCQLDETLQSKAYTSLGIEGHLSSAPVAQLVRTSDRRSRFWSQHPGSSLILYIYIWTQFMNMSLTCKSECKCN